MTFADVVRNPLSGAFVAFVAAVMVIDMFFRVRGAVLKEPSKAKVG